MSGLSKTLLVDVGNTRTKYAWRLADDSVSAVSYIAQVDELVPALNQAEKVVLSCVGHAEWLNIIRQSCDEQGVQLISAEVRPEHNGLRCAYRDVSTLGVDRWLAMLALQASCSSPFAVVQLGTALTCDIVSENVHQGGWIAPGYQLMRKAVTTNTEKVFTDASMPSQLSIGQSTPECVNLGCLAACHGFVQQACEWMNRHYPEYSVYISGGDAQLIDICAPQIHKIEHIVLRGLAVY